MAIQTGEPIKRYRVKWDGKSLPNRAELRVVPIAQIRRDPDYQRDINEKWVADHLPFVPEQAGTIVLSLRAGGHFVVDGGHRVALGRASGVTEMMAFVIHDLTKAQEAALFVRLQRNRRNLGAWDLYRAELVEGEPETVAMVDEVHRCGFRIDRKSGGDPKVITAIDSLRYVYRLGGASLVRDVLQLITDCMWLNLDRALSGPILKGLGIFLDSEQQRPVYERERVVKTLRHNAPTFLLLKAQEIAIVRRSASVSASNVAEAVLNLYNDRLPNQKKLPTLTIKDRKRPAPRNAPA